ncbi:MAG: vWA domain-containing protein [Pirellulaceae bacterium]|nr:VWA domain-containing protein [Planctomycetales bacterium]
MSFRAPFVIMGLLCLLPVLLLAWPWVREGRRVVLPFDFGRQRQGRWLRGLLGCIEMLPALLLLCIVLVLCGPLQLSEPRMKRSLTNIQFCVDVSGSMTASFGEGTRYDASMKAINDFLDYREGDAFGLTFFGNNVLHWIPLTSDISAFRCAPPFMRPEKIPYWFGGTEIGKALLACQDVLVAREEGDRMIVLISDGYSSDLSGDRDLEIAKELSGNGIIVYAVHIAEGSAPDQIVNITGLTGGEVFVPGDVEALDRVFRRIDEMQQARLEKSVAESMDFYAPFSVAGLSLLGLSLLAQFGLRYTPW